MVYCFLFKSPYHFFDVMERGTGTTREEANS